MVDGGLVFSSQSQISSGNQVGPGRFAIKQPRVEGSGDRLVELHLPVRLLLLGNEIKAVAMSVLRSMICTLTVLAILAFGLASPVLAQLGYGRTVALALAGDEVFVGESANRITPGYVYVYRRGSSGWVQESELAASDGIAANGFGSAIVVGEDLLLIGATGAGGGVVYVFERQGRQNQDWAEVGRLSADGLTSEDSFGNAIALSADGLDLIVGNAAHAEGRGAAYVFRRIGDGWQQVAKLLPDVEEPLEGSMDKKEEGGRQRRLKREPQATPRFGSAVTIAGEWAMVGAPGESQRAGSVYVLRRQEGTWFQFDKLTERGSQPESAFGTAIAMRDDELMVGAAGTAGVGSVHLFVRGQENGSGEWNPRSQLFPFDGGRSAGFGTSIAFDETEALIGAPGADRGQGSVYRYLRDERGVWGDASKIGTNSMSRRARMASSLAVSGGGKLMVVGAPGDDFGAGTALIMERSFGDWDRTKVFSDVKGRDAIVGHPTIKCADGKIADWACSNVDLVSFLPLHQLGAPRGVRLNDLWGWTDPETGRDYALVGLTDRASFIDVTDPSSPILVGTLPMTAGANGSSWRDIKVHANHAFVVSDGAGDHGVQIFELVRLRDFDGTPITFTEDVHYDLINSAHNIVINEDTAVAYVVGASGGGETCGGGLHMINIEDPREPLFEGCFTDTRTGRRGTGYSHDAQCVIYDGPDESYIGHEICFGSNETALSVADVTDKDHPVGLSMATYPNVAYTHQGWLTEDHRYFYMNDELDEPQGTVEGTRTLIFDVQELEDPILVGEYIHDVQATDHNLFIVGDRVYESNYDSGLRILDITDPESPELAGYFDTVSSSWSNYPFFDSGVVVVTAGREGLFLLRHDRAGDGLDGSGTR